MLLLICLGCLLFCSGCGNGGGSNPDPVFAWNFIKAVSPNYCLLGAPNWEQYFDMLKRYTINGLRVFAYAGWSDNYKYQGWDGGDISKINQGYLNGLKSFVLQANKKGIIVILSLFHKNGDPMAYAMNAGTDKVKTYTKTIVGAIKGLGVIVEPINEDIDQNFCNIVQAAAREVWPDAKTCFYALNGGTYRIEHINAKDYIGYGRIHSNDKAGYANYYTQQDYYNIAKQAKQAGGHTEFLFFWNKDKPPNKSAAEVEANYQEALNLLKTISVP